MENSVNNLKHSHNYVHVDEKNVKKTKYVLILTLAMMIVEIIAGLMYGSMALLADGWHMGTHGVAFALTLFVYYYDNKHKDNPLFSFGTGKVGVLGGFASAVMLMFVAILMLVESIKRIVHPEDIHYNEALLVAVLGLIINIVSVFLLHEKDHNDVNCKHKHHDHNLQAAYFHVLADALTSVFAIIALLFAKFMGINWMDAIVGIVGSIIIGKWAYGLISQTSFILLDKNTNQDLDLDIKKAIEDDFTKISDLHIWEIAPEHYGVIVCLVTKKPKDIFEYKNKLLFAKNVVHVSIEVNVCKD